MNGFGPLDDLILLFLELLEHFLPRSYHEARTTVVEDLSRFCRKASQGTTGQP